MITLESHGTATRETISLPAWRAAVDEIVCREVASSVDELDELITRERFARWYEAGESVAIAALSAASWVRAARPGVRAEREDRSLRLMLVSARNAKI